MTDANQIIAPNFERRVPEGDERMRDICRDCGFIHYINPKIVVGAKVLDSQGRILLCRRAIEPAINSWTLPAGFMEQGETAEEGAAREAWEEARAKLKIGKLIKHYSLPHISQVQLFFESELLNADEVAPGPESLEVAFFEPDNLPVQEIIFPTVRDMLGIK